MMGDFSDWITPKMLVEMAMYDLGYDSSAEGLPDADIKKIMHYIGVWATNVETPAIEKLN